MCSRQYCNSVLFSAPHHIVLTNVINAIGCDAITIGNGTEQAPKTVDINGMMCNKYRFELFQDIRSNHSTHLQVQSAEQKKIGEQWMGIRRRQ